MDQHANGYFLPIKAISVLSIIILAIVIMSFGLKNEGSRSTLNRGPVEKDSAASVAAFMDVYKVLMSPRCMNCHPAGDVPLQGDDSHIHSMLPQRGKEGKGVYAMKCSNCHQTANMEGPNKPPGHPDWHLPPASAKMIFQGKTPTQLARQLVDPKTNGNKSLQQLIEHADDGLVKVGWNMGGGRTSPPMSYAEFKKAWITWLENGAFAPPSK